MSASLSWTGRRVLVTGAGGFIGSHLTECLSRLGAQAVAFCRYNSQGSAGWLARLPREARAAITVRFGDIRDQTFVEGCCERIDTVFHLAAQVSIPYSFGSVQDVIDTNIRGTFNVLEAVRKRGCRRLVHTSTSEVYGTPQTIPITESHPLTAQSPYSASKIAADKLCESYAHTYGLPVVTLRPFNTYGPRQSTRAVIPTILTQLLAGRQEVDLGSLDPRRDFTYVDDTVRGFLAAAATPGIEGAVVHLGTGLTVSIAELLALCCEVTSVRAVPKAVSERMRPPHSEVWVLQSDRARARDLLGWEPLVPLREGLAITCAWLREHLSCYDVGQRHD
ncbi:MAG: SDR family NAD(P)-dependent oxidoreductase [Candidatus Schekmanbacteria bacterium]|nr:SDR family NAD(P)-dependent oxidoreductase [Candidatus Schekmanbacteria bacterium]